MQETGKESLNSKEAAENTQTKVKVKLTLPKLEYSEMKELENQLYKAGARYTNWEIPKEQSRDGKAHKGRSWYVMKTDSTDMTPFKEYVKDNVIESAPKQKKQSKLFMVTSSAGEPKQEETSQSRIKPLPAGRLNPIKQPEEMVSQQNLIETVLKNMQEMQETIQEMSKELSSLRQQLDEKSPKVSKNLEAASHELNTEDRSSVKGKLTQMKDRVKENGSENREFPEKRLEACIE